MAFHSHPTPADDSAPLPAEITEENLPDSLADGLLGLFRDGTTRLALLDLERWIRPA